MPVPSGRLLSIVAALGLGIAPAPPASAADPCAEDVRQLCPDVKLGSARVASCLRENQASLTDAAEAAFFKNEIGLGLAYYFDW